MAACEQELGNGAAWPELEARGDGDAATPEGWQRQEGRDSPGRIQRRGTWVTETEQSRAGCAAGQVLLRGRRPVMERK